MHVQNISLTPKFVLGTADFVYLLINLFLGLSDVLQKLFFVPGLAYFDACS